MLSDAWTTFADFMWVVTEIKKWDSDFISLSFTAWDNS